MASPIVIVATHAEGRAIRGVHKVVCGIGAERALRALADVISKGRPSLVVSAGFAGALDARLRVGDVLRPSRLLSETGAELRLDDGDGRTLLSVGRVVSIEEKHILRERWGADAVDMESFALAQEAKRLGLPFVALRAISDTANFALPPESEHWIAPDGSPRLAAVLRWVGFRPSRIGLLLELKRNADVASRALAATVGQHAH